MSVNKKETLDVLIALDSFKKSINSIDASMSIFNLWKKNRPQDNLHVAPCADGGEGSLAVHLFAKPGGKKINIKLPLPNNPNSEETIDSYWLLYDKSKKIGVFEIANSAGIELYKNKDPLKSSSYNLGLTLKAACKYNLDEAIICLGGSASNDLGLGMLSALGAIFKTKNKDTVIYDSTNLEKIVSVDLSNIKNVAKKITVLSDVNNPLIGDNGAIETFSKQKGASVKEQELLKKGFLHFSKMLSQESSYKVNPECAGTGAAGGVSFALLCIGGTIQSGSEYFSSLLNLEKYIIKSEIIITGEGEFDNQSLNGKVISNIVKKTDESNQLKTLVIVAGKISENIKTKSKTKYMYYDLSKISGDKNDSINNPIKYIQIASEKIIKDISF